MDGVIAYRDVTVQAEPLSSGSFWGRLEVFTEVEGDCFLDVIHVGHASRTIYDAYRDAAALQHRLGIEPIGDRA
jgi:hypothetical protein